MNDDEFKDLCNKQGWDSDLAQEYYNIISKIFDDALQKDTEFNEKLVNRQNEFHRTALQNYKNWMELYEKIRKTVDFKNGDEVDLMFLTRYLMTVESLASHYVTILYYACRKAYDDVDDKEHKSFNTVHNYISLGNKLEFIKKHGLKKYANHVDHKTRNSIGHMTFKINNGKIKIPENKTEIHGYDEINIEQMGENLDTHTIAIFAAIWRYYGQYSNVSSDISDWITHL